MRVGRERGPEGKAVGAVQTCPFPAVFAALSVFQAHRGGYERTRENTERLRERQQFRLSGRDLKNRLSCITRRHLSD